MKIQEQRYAQEGVKYKRLDRVLIKRLLSYLLPYRGWVFLAIILLIGARVVDAWVPIWIGRLVQELITFDAHSSNKEALFESILAGIGLILGWMIFGYLLDMISIWIKSSIGQKALFTLRIQVYQHIQRLPLSFFDRHPIGRLMTRTIHDVDQINQLFAESVIPIIGSLVLFASIIAAIFFLDWELGLATCVILPLTWWLVHRFRYNQRRCYDTMRSIISSLNAFVQEYLMGVSVIRNFGLHRQEKRKFEEFNQALFQSNMEAVHHFSFFFAGIDTLQNLSLIAIFVFLFVFSHPGQSFQAGNFFTFSLYVVMVFRPLLDLAERYNILQSAMAAAERIFEVLDTSVEQEGPTPGLPLNEIQSIVFEDVWLAYEKDNWILKGLSLTLQKETSIALIGMTGSGKTSVLSLLLGFYPFQKGRILINGQEIQNYNLFNLRRQFSMIIQDPVIFSGSVADNIALYDSTITLQQIQESAAFVNLLPFIEKFPHQFDHYLTERGTSLSAGEMQLISLARAVAHRRSVLIFDEATANIDIHTEKIIQDALKKVFHHQTALIVAHRLSTIRDVHVIYVLHQGKVIESGTHDQLLHQGGVYEKLYRLQFIQSPF